MHEHYVYILRCNDDSYYVGHTENLEVRMGEAVKEVWKKQEKYTRTDPSNSDHRSSPQDERIKVPIVRNGVKRKGKSSLLSTIFKNDSDQLP